MESSWFRLVVYLEKRRLSWKDWTEVGKINQFITIPCEGKAKTESFGKTQNISSKIEKLPSATSHQYLNIASSDGHIPSSLSLHPRATDHIRCLYQGSRHHTNFRSFKFYFLRFWPDRICVLGALVLMRLHIAGFPRGWLLLNPVVQSLIDHWYLNFRWSRDNRRQS